MHKEIEYWKKQAKRYFDIATWFATHDPGTPVPDWCILSWPPSSRLISKSPYEPRKIRNV